MTKLLGFIFDNAWGKAVAAAAGLLVMLGAFAADQRSRGRTNAIVEINDQAAEQVVDARKARDTVPDSGNAGWLRQRRCRDC